MQEVILDAVLPEDEHAPTRERLRVAAQAAILRELLGREGWSGGVTARRLAQELAGGLAALVGAFLEHHKGPDELQGPGAQLIAASSASQATSSAKLPPCASGPRPRWPSGQWVEVGGRSRRSPAGLTGARERLRGLF